MTNTKWLRRALLGGVALTVAGTAGARADELADLKAQLEALQSRVNTLEQQPAQQASNIPPGASFITAERGSRMDFVHGPTARDMVNNNDDAGFTIAVTPTADMPAPVAEIVVYGYVKGDVIYDVDGNTNHFSFSMPGQDRFDEDDDEFVFLHAAQTRFGIKTKVDTAVGQIRSRIEMDFFGGPFNVDGQCFDANDVDFCPRMRQAYGEWDMTPNWTLLAGQTDQLATLSIVGVTLVDFFGDAGINGGSRFAQVRLTYKDGPLTWAVGIEKPEEASDTLIPGFGGFLQYDIAGGHQIMIAGGASDIDADRPRFELLSDLELETPGEFIGEDDNHQLGWVVGGGANINLADIATFTAGAQYTRGLATRWMNQLSSERVVCENDAFAVDGSVLDLDCDDLQPAFGVTAGLSFNVNDTTSINVEGGYAQNIDAEDNDLLVVDNVYTVHGNILWQPVKQMRLGWEVMWGRENFIDPYKIDDDITGLEDDLKVCRVVNPDDEENGDCPDSSDALRFQFGAWFFF